MNTARALVLMALAATAGCAAPAVSPPAIAPPADPGIETMAVAERRGEKIGAPVDVRYQFAGQIAAGRPVALQIAVVPRVDGSNLRVELPASTGVTIAKAGPAAAFSKATGASAYRYDVELTPAANAPERIPVTVSMDVAGGRFFSVFSIPLRAKAAGSPIR
jgi:hypothetical protein